MLLPLKAHPPPSTFLSCSSPLQQRNTSYSSWGWNTFHDTEKVKNLQLDSTTLCYTKIKWTEHKHKMHVILKKQQHCTEKKNIAQQQQSDYWPVIMANKRESLSEILSFLLFWGRTKMRKFSTFLTYFNINILACNLFSTFNHYCTNKINTNTTVTYIWPYGIKIVKVT